MRFVSLSIAVIAGVVTVALWALANRPVSEPAWPVRIQGFALSPYHDGQDAIAGEYPAEEQIDADLALLGKRSRAVRTYTASGTIGKVPELAEARRIKVALGAWIDARRSQNRAEVERVKRLAKRHENVIRVIVGNEVVLRNDIPLAELASHLD
ncbi:MAG: beta-(1-3)-glucosyl transferase, partial [Gammaproteobacteria bacterium]|nr:beta-(1-3)-glucosyl transferase [Gammaproteobacteria bacterium]